jgi:tetratricopeptide (TPR) repeat protein
LLTAADRAVDALAVEQANELYGAAIQLAGDEDERAQIRLRRANAMLQLEQFSRARHEFAELLPALAGRERIQALIGRAHAALWTEQTDETMACATQALQEARAGDESDLEAVALGLVAGAHGMRGDDGDLAQAIQLGEDALRAWPQDTWRWDLAELHHLSSDHYYWAGDYPRAIESARLSATVAGVDLHSEEFVLRGAGMQSLILAGMGRYEEALVAADDALALAREMGRTVNVIMNYSTLPLREILAVEEALARSEEVADRLGPSDFNMPWMNARADCFAGWVMAGEMARAERAWDTLWEDALGSNAWERWLVTGRLASLRAELELAAGRTDDCLIWAERAVDLATKSGRKKYVAVAGTTLGRALTVSGQAPAAVVELQRAAALADALATPALRWPAYAALAEALAATGADPSPAWATAASVIHNLAAGLAPARAARFQSAPSVAAVLAATEPSP